MKLYSGEIYKVGLGYVNRKQKKKGKIKKQIQERKRILKKREKGVGKQCYRK